ncbi:MAG: hypothetical protein A2V69_02030 [Candidatus Portnoybacteria bacterium RBG_13_40_8]|uniref:DUF5666 domain-containing protein n=1 Tax=Candidatus Portnoybacteria bacterium RBG_13_40_8 TaxID=1801990 RepID=A0A1G2F1Z3_9BACT|nr:MAG: hypothetical protein A2V69_02030 [Candidatus Portnoybacteria bacterium RBG_13_40_8]OGZ35360.1 MAG: hypothetical protein A2V60_03550 [Candidatus Portnoybacteria bacterium RIFCSPHIGHO2_01_FULL_39_19]
MKKSYLIIGIIILIAVAIILYFIGYTAGKGSLESTISQYKKLLDYYVLVPEEIFSISGQITKIEGNALSVEATIEDRYKLPSEWEKKTMKALISNETKITKLKPIDPNQESSADSPIVTEVGFSVLKVGDYITVTAKENIKNKTEFIAKEINVIE